VPTYSYRCTECGNAFDVVQSFTDDSLTVCPVCQGTLRKVFSPVGVTFNGSGFYRTDSRSGSGSSSGPAGTSSTSSSSADKKSSGAKEKSPGGGASSSGSGTSSSGSSGSSSSGSSSGGSASSSS
jgi:putative FmdB family regulatory protein